MDMEPEDRARFDSVESINSGSLVMALLLGLVVGLLLGLLLGQYWGLWTMWGLLLVMVPIVLQFLLLLILLILMDKVLRLIKSEPLNLESVFSSYWLDSHPDMFNEFKLSIYRAKKNKKELSLEQEIFFLVKDISFAIVLMEVQKALRQATHSN
jgi:hypothetical protein